MKFQLGQNGLSSLAAHNLICLTAIIFSYVIVCRLPGFALTYSVLCGRPSLLRSLFAARPNRYYVLWCLLAFYPSTTNSSCNLTASINGWEGLRSMSKCFKNTSLSVSDNIMSIISSQMAGSGFYRFSGPGTQHPVAVLPCCILPSFQCVYSR